MCRLGAGAALAMPGQEPCVGRSVMKSIGLAIPASLLLLAGCMGEVGIVGGQPPISAGSADSGSQSGEDDGGSQTTPDATPLPRFSFFVTSLDTMLKQSNTEGAYNAAGVSEAGFGGNLGGLAGADQICQTAAASVGFGAKTWRAFLSVNDDGSGNMVHARDRIGTGPWYDKNERLIANDLTGLMQVRPDGDAQTVGSLPDETGTPVKLDKNGNEVDSHDVLTGSDSDGMLRGDSPEDTCGDWTSAAAGNNGDVWIGHAWPRGVDSARDWASQHTVQGCLPKINLDFNGGGPPGCDGVGCGGGWGGIYCFALTP